jgi:DNA-binding CsgD family transcriptional regulator
MDETEQVSRLIGDIYDASLDPDRWEDVLGQAGNFLSAATATLGSFDVVQRNVNLTKSWGYDPDYLRLYMERYAPINPLIPSSWLAGVGDVVSAADLMPYEEFQQTAMYREWGVPQGYIDAAQVMLEKTATVMAVFQVIRHERNGRVDDELRRRMTLLMPHFRRAILIGKVIDLHKVEAAAFADTLDGLAAGMFIVDADARIVHANARGRAILAESDVLTGLDGKLSAQNPGVEQALRDVFTAAKDGDAAIGARGITIPLSSRNGEHFVAHALPLTSGARRRVGMSYSAVAAFFVRKAEFDLPSPIEAMAARYRLTPAELRVLMAIIQVGGVPEVAPVLGISETTVKTHLQHVFEKTGVNRQADLVKLVAEFMSPFSAQASAS